MWKDDTDLQVLSRKCPERELLASHRGVDEVKDPRGFGLEFEDNQEAGDEIRQSGHQKQHRDVLTQIFSPLPEEIHFD